jgi:hypothetical protein
VAVGLRGVLGALVLTVVAGLLLLPGLAVGPSLDASIFSTVGWRLAEGDALYAEAWDHKPPGAYVPHLLAHLLADAPAGAWFATWLLSVLALAGAAIAVRGVLGRAGIRPLAADGGALLFVLGAAAYLVSLGGGMSETFALPALAVALLAAVGGRWMLAGLAGALAVIVSLQAVPVVAALAVLGATRATGITARRAGLVAAAALTVVGAAAVAVWANGGLAAAADALVAYSAAYRQVTARSGGASAFSLVPWTLLVMLPLLVGIGLAVVNRRRLAGGRLALASATWILAGVALVVVQGRFYAHYAAPLVIPMAILGGLGLDAAWRSAPARARGAIVVVPMLLAVAVAMAVGAAGAAQEQAPILASNRRAEAVAERIRSLTAPDDSIFVWGNDARIYELAGRAPAARYVYLYPLLTPGYVSETRIAEVVAELEDRRPVVVVDSGSLAPGEPGLPPLLDPRPVATDGRDEDLLDPLRDIVRRSFELDAVVDGWPVYVRD